MNDKLLEFTDIIDEEIQAYESLGELYKMKQTILVQGKSGALWDIDAQIIDASNVLKTLNEKRKQIAGYLGDENLTMSQAIEKAKEADKKLAEKMTTQRTKLKILSKSLTLQEKTNVTLIKHGLTMVHKTLDIIMNVVAPHSKQYNKDGKNVDVDKGLISSVVEEA